MQLGLHFRGAGSPREAPTRALLLARLLAPLLIVVVFLIVPVALDSSKAAERCQSSSEESHMNFEVTSAVFMLAAPCLAQSLDLARTTDTVRLTHEVPASNELTIEAQVWLPEGPSTIASLTHVIWREQKNSFEDKGMAVCSGGVMFYGSGSIPTVRWEGAVPASEWVHIACQANYGLARIWVNGELVAEAGSSSANPVAGVTGSSNCIGAGLHNGFQVVPGAVCLIDWLRVSTCVRYSTTQFDPPRECDLGEPDAHTALLFMFDEPAGAATLMNRGYAIGTAQVGAAWFSGATAPTLARPGQECCPSDLDDSGTTNGVDLAIILQNWGSPSPKYPQADITGDGVVNGADLAIVLSSWGNCP